MTHTLPKDRLLKLYEQMLRIRRTEEQLAKSHQRGLIHGACHTYVGEEAIAVGVCAHLSHEDTVFSTHRGHGHALAKGVTPEQLIAELYGRETGISRGRGGSMHLFAPEVGLMGTSGIVGPCILQAAGAGYSSMLMKTGRVGVAFFGDGAVNNGAFHEGLNLASIWKLPTIFVCENNQYATEVPFQYAAGNPTVASRAAAYGMPGVQVNGNDVLAVHAAAAEAIERARAGGGPTLIECITYRTRPHAEGMGDFTYRTREEVEQWKARCPILRLKKHLLTGAIATEEELSSIESAIVAEVEKGNRVAEAAPWPDPAKATTHVYAETGRSSCRPAIRITPSPTRSEGEEISSPSLRVGLGVPLDAQLAIVNSTPHRAPLRKAFASWLTKSARSKLTSVPYFVAAARPSGIIPKILKTSWARVEPPSTTLLMDLKCIILSRRRSRPAPIQGPTWIICRGPGCPWPAAVRPSC